MPNDPPVQSVTRKVWSWRRGDVMHARPDALTVEEPLEIRVNTVPVAVTMRTPGHDEELVLGFLVSEGVIERVDQIVRMRPYPRNRLGNVLETYVSPETKLDLRQLTRHVFGSSSCGLCGKATIQAVRGRFHPLRSRRTWKASMLARLPETMAQAQETFAQTGGLHAAAIFTPGGKLIVLREDVGRHNAVDKVLGYGLQRRAFPFDNHVLLVSGRASFEIMQKALAARIPVVAALSAPSSLAVEFARANGQVLVGFLRRDQMNIYAGRDRVKFKSRVGS